MSACVCACSLGLALTAGALPCTPGSASQCNSSCLAAQSWTGMLTAHGLLQAATSVSQGYHRNLSTALSDMYQDHIGSFLAEALSRLAGNKLDLISLMHAQLEWATVRPADNSLVCAFVRLCTARSIAELPALASQVHSVSVSSRSPEDIQPAHHFPLSLQVDSMLSSLKVRPTVIGCYLCQFAWSNTAFNSQTCALR